MRFCPFCSAENESPSAECAECGRRLPPRPPKRRATSKVVPIDATGESAPPQDSAASSSGSSSPEAKPHPGGASAILENLRIGGAQKRLPPTQESSRSSAEPARRGSDVDESSGQGLYGEGAADKDLEPAAVPPVAAPVPPAPEPAAPVVPTPITATESGNWPAPERPAPQYDPHDWQQNMRSSGSSEDVRRAAGDLAIQYKPVAVIAIPDLPEAGLVAAARYTLQFWRARYQRTRAMKRLKGTINSDNTALDDVLARLGVQARAIELEVPSLDRENRALDAAEDKRRRADHACAELSNQQAEENGKFTEVESVRQSKVTDADAALELVKTEQGALEAQRRSLRDTLKGLEKRQRTYKKGAEDRDSESEKKQIPDERDALRRSATELRRDAANLEPELRDVARRVGALDGPISHTTGKIEALRAEVDAAKSALADARESHRLHMAEFEVELGRRTRELGQAESEIQRRLITLGTLVNLHRIDRDELEPHYEDIDRLRGAIGSRTNEIDRLSAEREAYDKVSLVRGSVVIGGSGLGVVLLFVVLAWLF